MPAADFVAAQERLAARHRAREIAAQTAAAERAAQLSQSPISRLPAPFLQQIAATGQSAWDVISGREGTKPAFRVGQVDAELLDEEALELLKNQFSEGLKYFGSNLSMTYSAEIQLLLRAALFKLSIWDHNASYGASLQGLRYADARARSSSTSDGTAIPDSSLPIPSTFQKAVYGLVTVLGKYGWAKWNNFLADREASFEEPNAGVKRLSRVTSLCDAAHTLLAVPSFALFLLDGRYRTIVDRVLGMRLVPASSSTARDVSFEYLNRQLVWHAFTEFLLFLLPLVGVSRWRRMYRKGWRRLAKLFKSVRSHLSFLPLAAGASAHEEDEDEGVLGGQFGHLPPRTCAICYADQSPGVGVTEKGGTAGASVGAGVIGSALTDITNPYEANPCRCVYCFSCLAQRLEAEEGEGWVCLRCGETVMSCRPWSGDVVDVLEVTTAGASHDRDPRSGTPERRLSTASTVPYSPAAAAGLGDGMSPLRTGPDGPVKRKAVGFAASVPFGAGQDGFGAEDGDGGSDSGIGIGIGIGIGDGDGDADADGPPVRFSALDFSPSVLAEMDDGAEWGRSSAGEDDQSEEYDQEEDEMGV